jgi:hypothetical protein
MRRFLNITVLALTAFLIEAVVFPRASFAQLREQIQGVWILQSAITTRGDGGTYETFGPNPRGLLMIDRGGRYSLQTVRSDRPRFASGVRSSGTDEENRAAVIGTNTHFGRYTVNEITRVINFRVDGSSFPNWDGTLRRRRVTFVDATRLRWVTIEPPGILVSTITWRRP